MSLSKKKVLSYIEEKTGKPAEIQMYNDTEYIKFDFLPYQLREEIHKLSEYDESKMVLLPRECQCGYAYFYESNHFFGLCKQIKNL